MDFIQVLTVVLLWNIIEPSYSSKPCKYTRYSNWYVNLTCDWNDVVGLHDNSNCTDVRGYIIEYWRTMSPSRVYNITVNESLHHNVSLHVSYYYSYQVEVRVKCEYNETVMIGSRSFLLNISKENTPDITGFSPVDSYMVENTNNIDMRCYDGLIEYNYILNFGVGLWVNDIGTHFGEKELNNQDNDITTSIFTKDATYSHKLNGVVVNRVLFPESVGVRRIGVKYMWTKSNGIVASISMVFLAKNAPIVAAEEHRTISTSIGESIELVVTTSDTVNTNNLKWKKDGIIDISEWDGLSNVTIENVRRKDDGIYECYQEGHRDEGQHAIVRVIVRECPRGKWFPPDCELDCPVCYNGGVCTEFGSCICPPGFKGYNCEKACGNNLWGRNCTIICTTKAKPNKCKQGNLHCLPDPYGCSCFTGFKGIECDKDCNTATTGRYGANCLMECHCDTSDCSQTEGCAEGAQCNSNYTGETCLEMKSNVTCSEGYYGPECAKRCHCKHSSTCNRTSGRCPDGDHCAEGWAGLGCQQALPALSDAPVVETFDNEVKVYWSSWKPNNDYGQGTVTSYQLLFWATNTTNDKHLNITNGVEANVSWTHMKYHTEYSFVVKVFTGVGQTLELGKASPAAKHTIYPPSLLRPPSLQSRGSLGVNITWDEWTYVFEKGIGNVTAYVIEWWNAVYTYNISASMYTGDPSEGILIPNITYDTILVVTIRTMYVDGSGEQKGEASPVLVILKDKCPYDWKLFEDTCYLLDGSLLNWNDANAFCQKQNASLVSIASQSENAYIKQLAQDKSYDYIWIGLNFQIFSSNWYWSTEEILLYQNWQQGTPDIALGECAYFNTSSGLWSSMLCQSNNTVICQKGVQHFGCLDETWYGYKDECYKYFNNRTTHDEAAQSCRSFRNADQASIHSLDEDEFVQTIIRNFCNETWLGLHYSKTFDLQWTDGTDVDYNYNTNIDVHNQCAAYSQDDHIFSWKFMNCSTQNAYVCKDIRDQQMKRT